MTEQAGARRVWKPDIGARVKLKLWEHYALLKQDEEEHQKPGMWAWLKVLAHQEAGDGFLAGPLVRVQDVHSPWTGFVQLFQIEAPLGWQPAYLATAGDLEKAEKLKLWADTRGIAVWANHDLYSGPGGTGSLVFTPGDVTEKPGWKYGHVETLSLALCQQVFSIEWREQKTASDGAEAEKMRAAGWVPYYDKRTRIWHVSRAHRVFTANEVPDEG